MRSPLLVGLGIALAFLLGAQQAISDVLARNGAQRMSLLLLLPSSVDDRYMLVPAQRLVAARRALAEGKAAQARRELAALPASPDRMALEAQLAEQEGDQRRALALYLAAGDLEGLNRVLARRQAQGDLRGALSLQLEIVRRLAASRTQSDALADAWWRLGQIYAALGYKEPSRGVLFRRQALEAYERALALAPFSQTYLLNAGYQAFDLGESARAGALFARAHDADPKSVNALVGLGRVALLRGDRASAGGYLAAAQAIDPSLPDVVRLAQQIAR